MLPVLALFHLLHEFGPDHFRAVRDVAAGFGAHVESFHQVVRPAGDRIVERAVEGGRADKRAQFFRRWRGRDGARARCGGRCHRAYAGA